MSYGTPGGEYHSACRAAIITEVNSPVDKLNLHPVVALCVINPTGQFYNTTIAYDTQQRPGTWHWPERVDE